MKLSRANALVRIFEFNYRFSDNTAPANTDLCHFMRVILVWLPLKFAFGLFTVAAAALLFLLAFDAFYRWWPLLYAVFWSGVASIFVVTYMWSEHYGKMERLSKVLNKPFPRIEGLEIFGAWLAAKKAKICPLVEIVEPE